MKKKTAKQPKNKTFQPNPEDRKLINELETKMGLNFTTIARLALRSLAKEQGIRQ
jgi:hypothetical protein